MNPKRCVEEDSVLLILVISSFNSTRITKGECYNADVHRLLHEKDCRLHKVGICIVNRHPRYLTDVTEHTFRSSALVHS